MPAVRGAASARLAPRYGAARQRPAPERLHRRRERRAERRERVVDAWRDLGVDLAMDQAVALHRPQRLGQDLLRDRLQLAEQLVIAPRPVAPREQDVDAPLRREEAERIADETGRTGAFCDAKGSGCGGHGGEFNCPVDTVSLDRRAKSCGFGLAALASFRSCPASESPASTWRAGSACRSPPCPWSSRARPRGASPRARRPPCARPRPNWATGPTRR